MNKIINKRNGIIAAIAVVLIVAAIILSTTFTQAMTLDEAKEIAKKYVPSTATFVTSEEEENKFEVMFHDDKNEEGFEVEINKETKQVKKVESQLDNDLGSKTVKLSESDVKKIVKKAFDGITSISANLTKDNGLYEYEVNFKSNDFYGNADVNPETGAILESTIKYGTAVTIPTDDQNKGDILTYEEAEKAAIKEAGGGFVKDIDLERKNGNYYYEIELIKDNVEYDYIVDAKTGKVTLEHEHDSYFDYDDDDDWDDEDDHYNPGTTGGNTGTNGNSGNSGSASGNTSGSNNGLISVEKAKSIVLAKIPGATIVKIHLEKDDGIYIYEGEARLGNYEYDFEINASSGVIIDWDKDRIEYDDDDDDDYDDYDDDWDD